MPSLRQTSYALVALAMGASGAVARGDAPGIAYSGRITDEAGSPQAGTVDLELAFFNVQTGGSPLAPALQFPRTQLVDGVFQIVISPETTGFQDLLTEAAGSLFVEVRDLTHGRSHPRQRYLAIPYALRVPVDELTLRFDANGLLQLGPSTPPAPGQFLTKDDTGALTWATPGVAYSGEISGTMGNLVVDRVGGVLAADIAAGAAAANGASSANTASSLVRRDASGSFAAGTITATGFIGPLTGNATSATTAASFSGSLSGDVTGTQGATVVSAVGGKSASQIATSVESTQSATDADTAATIVKRDASGDFAAGTITADLVGDVTGNVSGSAAAFTGSLAGDVTGTQGVTVVASVGGKSAAQIATSAQAITDATASNNATTLVKRDASGNFSAGRGRFDDSVRVKDNDATPNYVSIKAPSTLAADVTYTFPGAPAANQLLTTDASGILTWTSPGTVGVGDMAKADYDQDADNIVDDSAALGGFGSSYYTNASNLSAGTIASTRLPAATPTLLGAIKATSPYLTVDGSGTITSLTADSAASFTGNLAGDVTGSQGTTVIANVGGKTAAQIAASVTATTAATDANTASTLVKRDASGNFTAGTITASLAGHATTATTATNFSGSLSGDVTGTQGATTVAAVGGKTAAQLATSVDDTTSATNANTASTIVKRDASGNFSAGTITASLNGNATSATTAAGFSGNLAGDVTGTQGATVVASIGAKTAAQVAASVTATTNATDANTASTLVKRDASGNFSAGTITASLNGNATTATTATTATSFSGSLAGDVTGPQGTTVVATVGGKTAAQVATSVNDTTSAASANTVSTIVKRDASGNFSAGTITASLSGNATSATTAANFSGSLAGDVTGTQGATAIAAGAVTAAKMAQNGCATNQILKWNGTSWACAYPPDVLKGLLLKYVSANVVSVGVGSTYSDDGTEEIVLSGVTNATLGTTGANGVESGSASDQASTWYSVWVIKQPGTSNVATLLSLSSTSPTIPAPYTKKRRVGWLYNNASSNVMPFSARDTTMGRYFSQGAVSAAIAGATTTALQTYNTALPPATQWASVQIFAYKYYNSGAYSVSDCYVGNGDNLGVAVRQVEVYSGNDASVIYGANGTTSFNSGDVAVYIDGSSNRQLNTWCTGTALTTKTLAVTGWYDAL